MILALTKRTFEEYDEDRKRFARELHSSALQDLAALQMNLSLIPGESLPPRAAKALAECAALAESCARGIRTACDRLYPTLLDHAGLAAAVRAFAAQTGIKLMPDMPEDFGPLPDRIAIGAFRVAEELVGGCETPARTTLNVVLEGNSLGISVGGAGEIRQSVRDRVAALGGKLALFQTGDCRTVVVHLPLTDEES
jgi:signal transduction histidine kinase